MNSKNKPESFYPIEPDTIDEFEELKRLVMQGTIGDRELFNWGITAPELFRIVLNGITEEAVRLLPLAIANGDTHAVGVITNLTIVNRMVRDSGEELQGYSDWELAHYDPDLPSILPSQLS